MSRIVWDEESKRTFETGVDHGVLYLRDSTGAYGNGVAWNGLTGVTESPSGAEATPLWADNIKYLNLRSAEEFGATIEAYTYPDEFAECDGSYSIDGVSVGQQTRRMFGLSYRTVYGNAIEGNNYGYKLHLIYGCEAAPSEKSYSTINDSPDAITFSWEISTTPVAFTSSEWATDAGLKPTASLVIDSTKVSATKMKALEDLLYGSDVGAYSTTSGPKLPTPDEVLDLLTEEDET